ncbi:hypothetical protein OH76DRAFT_1561887 [Lentinus brumalis]|uniref:Uncharacterized protein n=1 Tax=Lentinus brumalis TaxID=2498619 RepID=A0A371CKT8_9APHY|nr:hypothetical protein OH76DRAFT_1561887 [Polyporus brumalis]
MTRARRKRGSRGGSQPTRGRGRPSGRRATNVAESGPRATSQQGAGGSVLESSTEVRRDSTAAREARARHRAQNRDNNHNDTGTGERSNDSVLNAVHDQYHRAFEDDEDLTSVSSDEDIPPMSTTHSSTGTTSSDFEMLRSDEEVEQEEPAIRLEDATDLSAHSNEDHTVNVNSDDAVPVNAPPFSTDPSPFGVPAGLTHSGLISRTSSIAHALTPLEELPRGPRQHPSTPTRQRTSYGGSTLVHSNRRAASATPTRPRAARGIPPWTVPSTPVHHEDRGPPTSLPLDWNMPGLTNTSTAMEQLDIDNEEPAEENAPQASSDLEEDDSRAGNVFLGTYRPVDVDITLMHQHVAAGSGEYDAGPSTIAQSSDTVERHASHWYAPRRSASPPHAALDRALQEMDPRAASSSRTENRASAPSGLAVDAQAGTRAHHAPPRFPGAATTRQPGVHVPAAAAQQPPAHLTAAAPAQHHPAHITATQLAQQPPAHLTAAAPAQHHPAHIAAPQLAQQPPAHLAAAALAQHHPVHIAATQLAQQPPAHLAAAAPAQHHPAHIAAPQLAQQPPAHLAAAAPAQHHPAHIAAPQLAQQPAAHLPVAAPAPAQAAPAQGLNALPAAVAPQPLQRATWHRVPPNVPPAVWEYLQERFPERFQELEAVYQPPMRGRYGTAYVQLIHLRITGSTLRDLRIGSGHGEPREAFVLHDGVHLVISYNDVAAVFNSTVPTYRTWRSRLVGPYATYRWMTRNPNRWGMNGEIDHPHLQLYDALTQFFGRHRLPPHGELPATQQPSVDQLATMSMEERARRRVEGIAHRRAVELAQTWSFAQLRDETANFLRAMGVDPKKLPAVPVSLD